MRGVVRTLCLTVALLVAVPAPASAHDVLLSTVPEDAQVLSSAPEEVVLTFSGEVMDVSTAVVVLDPRAETVSTSAPEVDGHQVSVRTLEEVPEGGYAVRWRVVSSDGHPISGTFTFQVGEGGPPPPALDAAPAEARSPAAETASDQGTADASNASTPFVPLRTSALALIGALGGVLLYVIVLRLRRASAPAAPTVNPTDPSEKETR